MALTHPPRSFGITARLKDHKGFSLIELAIVLVIIGIIVIAILKGNDLLFNSRTKQFVSTANAWKISAYAYMDRRNRFPGDSSRNGYIGDETTPVDEQTSPNTATDEIATKLSDVPVNPVLIGGQSWWFYFGYLTLAGGSKINAMVICPSADCTVGLSPNNVEMLSALDSSIDGIPDAGMGLLRGLSSGVAATVGHGVTVVATPSVAGRANGVVNLLVAADLEDATSLGTEIPWAVGQYGAVWAFDNKF
ncbi:MAG: prepilin-type N-terminal cleavage/methylation domain-containing protein [Desulfuromonadaceae bacterium]|nr:prepilin-type N-terminal cleavage/methylation domain-containing protein [Desulfuromonadaceae bacterium]MDD5104090.1 prepilin-type N-terminal cleavage/methylation domain-containing protein [Desulfuromonadaceae bacterium]